MKIQNLNEINTTALAYMGAAVYEQAVREHVIKKGSYHVGNMHKLSTDLDVYKRQILYKPGI